MVAASASWELTPNVPTAMAIACTQAHVSECLLTNSWSTVLQALSAQLRELLARGTMQWAHELEVVGRSSEALHVGRTQSARKKSWGQLVLNAPQACSRLHGKQCSTI